MEHDQLGRSCKEIELTVKLLLIEDERELSESIVEYLHDEGYRCEAAFDAREGLEKVMTHDYDCVLLDLTLPGGDGLAVLEQIKSEGRMDGVIIISARDSLDDKVAGLRLGADDYLPKPFHLPELSARIHALIRRRNFHTDNKIVFQELTVEISSQHTFVHDTRINLTRKEYGLLLFFLSNQGKAISKDAIAEHLTGGVANVVDNNQGLVYAHISNLKKKLSEAGSGDYIKTIHCFGYRWSA